MQVPFFGSMVHLEVFLLGVWFGWSHTGMRVFPAEFPEVDVEEEEEELLEESLQILKHTSLGT